MNTLTCEAADLVALLLGDEVSDLEFDYVVDALVADWMTPAR